jgi:hypothetical protein
MPRKTTRLYYGQQKETGKRLYWTIKVRNATKPVVLNGTVEHAMAGGRGVSIGCHLSNTAEAHKEAFPHPVLYVSFTKSVALVITKITKGQPSECVRYRHNYGQYVDLNDKDPSKAAVKAHPDLFNRRFTLGAYKQSEAHWRPEYGRRETGQRSKQQMAKGERARFQNAGLVFPDLT